MVNEPPGQIAPLLSVMLSPEVTVTDVVAVCRTYTTKCMLFHLQLYVVVAVGLTTRTST